MSQIAVYTEPLKVFTSGKPGRDILEALIESRPNDHFQLLYLEGSEKDLVLGPYLDSLARKSNVSLSAKKVRSRSLNLKVLLGVYNPAFFDGGADLYLSMDAIPVGPAGKPRLCVLADMSALAGKQFSSLNWLGRKLRRTTYKYMVKQAETIICISHATQMDLQARFKITSESCVVAYNGVNEAWFEQEQNLKEDGPLIWYGYVSKRKNLETFLEALTQIDVDFKFEIIADGRMEDLQRIRQVINSKNLDQKVSLVNPLPLNELIQKVDKSRGLVFPSLYEGFGMPVMECFARKKQVLCADLPVLRELSDDLAIFFDPDSVESIQQALLRFLLHPGGMPADKLRRRAENFTVKEAAKQYSRIIDRALS